MDHNMTDLELEDNPLSSAPHNVRKSINLNLTKKTKSKTKSSVKSNKSRSKRERDDGRSEESFDGKNLSRRNKSERKRENSEDERENEELDWSHKIMFVGEKIQNPVIHVCESCTLPILIYGRLSPCKHVFCLSCAENSNGECVRCEERIDRIEPATIGQIFVCSFGGNRNITSGCRRSYLSQRDLIAHIRHRHEKEGSTILENELLRQQGMPIFSIPPNLIAPPGMNLRASNAVVIAGLAPNRQQQAIFVDANRMPILSSSQTQFNSLQPGVQLGQQFPAAYQYLPAQMSTSTTAIQNTQQQLTPSLQTVQQTNTRQDLHSSRVSTPQQSLAMRSHGDWGGSSPMTSAGQEWTNQGRGGGYQPQFYK
ncbi:E3 ubiquitin-protein ligase Hakai isoform X1 [Hydra vulgaris]|uniref:E3 ubiquitin-protein ligase Hakai isoform X1 n=1 Tax=Hydra vulgaris TaxID=6087 RepID=UPI001F5F5DAA|nr:E3 ubiquitin-protein ligase Hakai [Hydra vulgaris]